MSFWIVDRGLSAQTTHAWWNMILCTSLNWACGKKNYPSIWKQAVNIEFIWFGSLSAKLLAPRPYTDGLYKRLSRRKQRAMKKRAKGKMVIHYEGFDGQKKVSAT